MVGRLYIDFCGEDHGIDPGGSLQFGREADLQIDTNPYLHRVLGRFVERRGQWCLDNLGRSTILTMTDCAGLTSVTVLPGGSAAVCHGEFVVGFCAGTLRYEIEGSLDPADAVDGEVGVVEGTGGVRTLEWGVVELTEEQHLLLIALCADRLADPDAEPVPVPNRSETAHSLGWSLPKFNRKLDHLCLKMERAGVMGLTGQYGVPAMHRRQRLADHALDVGLVRPEHLELLVQPETESPVAVFDTAN